VSRSPRSAGPPGLARAGLLDARAHTSAAPEYLAYAGGAYAGHAHYRHEPAVTDHGVITAGPTRPVEFAHAALALLDVYPPDVLDGWYRAFAAQDTSGLAALASATA
jgi:hypothetical protein